MPEVLTTPIRRVIDCAKSVVQDDHAKLRDALADVRRLQDALNSIKNDIAARKFALLKKCASNMPPMSLVAGVTAADPQEGWRELVRQNPDWRETLRRACAIKLAIAQAAYKVANERVREELADEKFSEAEIMSHPRLRRTNAAVSLWKILLAQCDAKDAEMLWKTVTRNLAT